MAWLPQDVKLRSIEEHFPYIWYQCCQQLSGKPVFKTVDYYLPCTISFELLKSRVFFQDTSKKAVLKQIEFADSYQEEEIISMALKDVGLI